MKNLLILSIMILTLLTFGNLTAQTIAVLPFYSLGIDEVSIETSESILKNELQKLGQINVTPIEEVKAILGDK
ncbi:MAG: hypothetical protein HOB92_01010, partial [Candidatus Cloacimonetes bacterium]|nr:hypothetical protein [Candidatus Cloacimonadota bacterium]